MAEKVYKLVMATGKEAWYRLTANEREDLKNKVKAALEKVGGKRVKVCNTRWCTEKWAVFGIEEFPSIEAVQQHTAILDELEWPRYLESMTLLGTDMPGVE